MNKNERKILNIRVEGIDDFFERVGEEIRDIEEGGTPEEEFGVSFHSREELHRILSDSNMELIETVVEQEPNSIRELARLVDRDVHRVHDNITELESLGLVELEEGERNAKKPVVWYDEIEITVPLRDEDVEATA